MSLGIATKQITSDLTNIINGSDRHCLSIRTIMDLTLFINFKSNSDFTVTVKTKSGDFIDFNQDQIFELIFDLVDYLKKDCPLFIASQFGFISYA